MNKNIVQRVLVMLALFWVTMPAASAYDRLYIDAVNIEPGETRQLAFVLENSQEFFGFQADISLPEGLEFVISDNKSDFKLSSRADGADFSLVSNVLAGGQLRVGAFSTTHSAISGNNGVLFYVGVHAADNFAGGTLSVGNILFINSTDNDVELPDYSISMGIKHNDSFFMPDFKISVGETKPVSLILENETAFTAFQTDIYLPVGLNVVADSFELTSRGTSGHRVSAKSFSDGRTRIICMSTDNSVFSGNNGALLNFKVTANKDAAESGTIELKNQIFSMANAKEYVLPNSQTAVVTERALVQEIFFDNTSLSMTVGDTRIVSATVMPEFASTKDLEWSSSNQAVATVSQNGVVTAVGIGSAVITAAAVDGSGVTADCSVTVSGVPVAGITLNRTEARIRAAETLSLVATVNPANATEKGVTWECADNAIAVVDDKGTVTAISVGKTSVTATSVSNPEISATCQVSVVPTMVSEIRLSQYESSLQIGSSLQLSCSVLPETATNKSVVWSVGDPAVATVSESGEVTAISLGTTNITVSAADGSGVTAVAIINVVPTPAESIVITPLESTEFEVGQTIKLMATVLPENATDKSVYWSSSNADIAIVSAEGVVTAVGVGEVTISAVNSAGNSAEIALTVVPTKAESISIDPDELMLQVGREATLYVDFQPQTTTNKNLIFESSNTDVATVDSKGVVVAHSIGEAVVTATTTDGSDKSAQCRVHVVETPVQSVSIVYGGPNQLRVGDTAQLSAKVLPEDATDKSVRWETQTANVLTVDQNGLVTAVGLGTALISATVSSGQSAYANFTVVPTLVSSITLSETVVEIKAGESVELGAVIAPEDATDKTILWRSDNTAVATVSQDGVVSGVAVGNADIFAEAVDGSGVKARCNVSVVPTPVESVSIIANGPILLKDGESIKLTAMVLPSAATDKSLIWYSSDDGVASVDDGLVTAHAKTGTARITAIAHNDVSDYVEINVVPTPAESVEVSASANRIKVGETLQLYAEVVPSTATDKLVMWSSSDESIFTVSEDGMLTAIAPGNAYVYAELKNGVKGAMLISVDPIMVESISIPSQIELGVGEQYVFSPEITPDNASAKQLLWESSNIGIGTVSDGLFMAKMQGQTTVTCRSTDGSNISASCVVTVVRYASGIVMSEHNLILDEGDKLQLTAEIEPVDATDKEVVWSSSDNDVVAVDHNGVIEAMAEGKAVVTVAIRSCPSVFDECNVTVTNESGIEEVTIGGAKVRIENHTIIIEGLQPQSVVGLLSVDGHKLLARRFVEPVLRIDVDTSGFYIVTLGRYSLKVAVK